MSTWLCWWRLVAFTALLLGWCEGQSCPPGCYCDSKKASHVPGGLGVKVSCHLLMSGGLRDFSGLLPNTTIQLDLANYDLDSVTPAMFGNLVFLQKLFLQNNEISAIQDGSFRNLGRHLQVIDLSGNKLLRVSKGTFAGLNNLERLKLNDNRIQTLEEGSLDDLARLAKLEIADNTLVCNCSLSWFLVWLANRPSSGVLGNAANTRCALPIELAEPPLRKLDPTAMKCNDGGLVGGSGRRRGGGGGSSSSESDDRTSLAKPKFKTNSESKSPIFITPSDERQIVFEGDSIRMSCRVQSKSANIEWFVNGKSVYELRRTSNVTETKSTNAGFKESLLTVNRLRELHSGEWRCTVGQAPADRQQRTKAVSVLVIAGANTKLCNPQVSETPRGTYHWNVALGGDTLEQPCEKVPTQTGGGRGGRAHAFHFCRPNGEWAAVVNTSQCAYTSQFTDTLHRFATMNTSFDSGTLLDSAKHFLKHTSDPATFKDPMDLVYFSMAVENYLPYLNRLRRQDRLDRNDQSVGRYMIDMITNVLGVDPDLMAKAQRRGVAGKRLLDVLENITAVVPNFGYQTELLVIEGHSPSPYDGLTCTWYSTDTPTMVTEYQRFEPKRVFHCSQTGGGGGKRPGPPSNKGSKQILASVEIPLTLYQQIQRRGGVGAGGRTRGELTIAAFANATLFPVQPSNGPGDPAGLYEEMDTLVIGAVLGGAGQFGNFNLTEDPINVIIRGSDVISTVLLNPMEGGGRVVEPVWWDQYANGGLGQWVPDFCTLRSARLSAVWFSCTRLGYYAYRIRQRSDASSAHGGYINKHKIDFGYRPHHPIVYASSVLCALLLALCVVAYSLCYSFITVSRKLQHSLLNLWLCFGWILFLFVTGMHQTEHQMTCRFVGLFVHFLTLSSLLWIMCAVHIVYTKVSGSASTATRNSPPQGGRSSHHSEKLPRKPVTRFYLMGYGVSLIIVAVSGAIDMHHYTTASHCFLKFAPFVGSTLVPAAIISALILGFALAAYCILCTAPTHVTEQIEFDYVGGASSGGGVGRLNPNTGSVMSLGVAGASAVFQTSGDAEKTAKSLLASLLSLLLMFVSTWAFGALSVAQPFGLGATATGSAGDSQQEVIFGVLYSMSCVSLGVFVLVYFLVSRSDVQHCFYTVCFFLWHGGSSGGKAMGGNLANEDEDGTEEANNLIHIFPRPQQQQQHDGQQHQPNTFQFPSAAAAAAAPPPGAAMLPEGGAVGAAGGTPLYLPGCVPQYGVLRSNSSVKAANLHNVFNKQARGGDRHHRQSDDGAVSSDHLSVNNVNHLRRGYVAPVNSEVDYSAAAAAAGLFNGAAGMQQPFDHRTTSMHKGQLQGQPASTSTLLMANAPKTSSPIAAAAAAQPAASFGVEQQLSPLAPIAVNNQDPLLYSVIPSAKGGTAAGDLIRLGDPCQMASYSTADFPSGLSSLVPSSVYGTPAGGGGGGKPPSTLMGPPPLPPPLQPQQGLFGATASSKSASSSRKSHRHATSRSRSSGNQQRRHRHNYRDDVMQQQQQRFTTDMDDIRSGSGRLSEDAVGGRSGPATSQRPPRRRRRKKKSSDVTSMNKQQHEPVYKNLRNNNDVVNVEDDDDEDEDDVYHGDADEMMMDVGVCREPLIEQSMEEQVMTTAPETAAAVAAACDDDNNEEGEQLAAGNNSSTSQYSTHSRFSSSDIPKRETSV